MKRRPSKPAFSLIEMLLVISIIILLISLTLPALSQAKRASYTAVCASNEHQIYEAYRNFKVDVAVQHTTNPMEAGAWPILLRNYVGKDTGVFVCPEDRDPAGAGYVGEFWAALGNYPNFSTFYDMQNGPLHRTVSGKQYQDIVNNFGSGDSGWWGYWAPGGLYEQDGGYREDGTGVYWLLVEDIIAGDGGPGGDRDFNDVQVRVEPKKDGTVDVYARQMTGNTFWVLYDDDHENIFKDFGANGKLQFGVTFGPVSLPGGSASYGMNQYVSGIGDEDRVLLLDYEKTSVLPDAVDGDDWDTYRDTQGHLSFARHVGFAANVLHSDGSIRPQDPDPLDPAFTNSQLQYWLP